MAVSLGIANAFTTPPWKCVGEVLKKHRVPRYLMGVTRAYFRERELEFVQRDGLLRRRRIGCGVPQGSVLGPLLWDFAYDRVLCLPLPRSCHAICYADDTLVVVTGVNWGTLWPRPRW